MSVETPDPRPKDQPGDAERDDDETTEQTGGGGMDPEDDRWAAEDGDDVD